MYIDASDRRFGHVQVQQTPADETIRRARIELFVST